VTVRRTPQAEAILAMRLSFTEACIALLDTDPDVLPGALRSARADVERKVAAAVKAGVAK